MCVAACSNLCQVNAWQHVQACLTLVLSAATRLLKSPEDLTAQADRSDHFLMTVARFCTISTVAAISKTVLGKLNSTTVVDDDRYKNLIQLIKYRPESKPLLTVSNHCSTLDDPTLFATLVPWSVDLRPKQMRWTICSEELCFMNAFTSMFFGSGKVLPIRRGGSIDQPLLLNFSRRLAAGRTVQTGHVGGRMGKNEAQIGSLKWGVGKM
eukprot:8431-Heterococcus_DN1.PRE.1